LEPFNNDGLTSEPVYLRTIVHQPIFYSEPAAGNSLRGNPDYI
jgi:hypothetical protein